MFYWYYFRKNKLRAIPSKLGNVIKYSKLIFLTIAIFFTLQTIAQTFEGNHFKPINIKTFGTSDGLPGSKIISFHQDHYGLIWTVTETGSYRFNGHQFEPISELLDVIKIDENTNTIDSQSLLAIDDKKHGPILVTNQGIKTNITLNTIHSINDLTAIAQNLWVGTNQGLVSLELNSKQLNKHNNKAINQIIHLDNKLFALEANKRITTLDIENFQKETIFDNSAHQNNDCGNDIKTFFIDHLNTIWLGAKTGLIRTNPNNNNLIRCYQPNNFTPKDTLQINAITEDLNGKIWLGTKNHGLYQFNREQETFKNIRIIDRATNYLSNQEITSLFVDKQGGIWIGTAYGLIHYYQPEFYQVESMFTVNSNHSIKALATDAGKKIIIATDSDLIHFEATKLQPTFYSLSNDQNNDPERILITNEFNRQQIWYTDDKFLNLLDLANNKQQQWLLPDDSIKKIDDLVSVEPNQVWLHKNESWLYQFNANQSVFKKIELQKDIKIKKIIYLKFNKNLLIATNKNLFLLDTASQQITEFSFNPQKTSNLFIENIFVDYSSNIWIIGNDQIWKTKLKNNKLHILGSIKEFTTKFLPTVLDIAQDNQNYLWLLSKQQLLQIDPTTLTIQTIHNSKLPSDVNEYYIALSSYHDHIIVISDRQLYRIERNAQVTHDQSQHFIVTKIKAKDKLINPLLLTENNTPLTLNYPAKNITFSLASLSSHSSKTAYRLKNFDHAWKTLNENQNINYSTIPPGKYQLEVSTNYKLTSNTETLLSIIISPPFWQTTTAKIIYSLMILIVMMLIIYFIKAIRQQKQNLDNATLQLQATTKINNYKNRLISTHAWIEELHQQLVALTQQEIIRIDFLLNVEYGLTTTVPFKKIENLNKELTAKLYNEYVKEIKIGKSTIINKTLKQIINGIFIEEKLVVILAITLSKTIKFNIDQLISYLSEIAPFIKRSLDDYEIQKYYQELNIKNKEKSNFIAQLSHEMRNPLNGILGMIELLNETKLSKQQQQYTASANKASQLLLSNINELLDYAKLANNKLELSIETFDLGLLIEDIIKLYAAKSIQEKTTLSYSIHQNVPRKLDGDPQRIQQILINLLANAFKFAKGKSITLHTEAINRNNSHVTIQFEITDTGMGIPITEKQLLFNPFTQANQQIAKEFGGTGLGLVICKQLINKMGGNIGIESKAKIGTRFVFDLNLAYHQPATKLAFNELSSVLVVDKNQNRKQSLKKTLQAINIQVYEAEKMESNKTNSFDLFILVIDEPNQPLANNIKNYAQNFPTILVLPFGQTETQIEIPYATTIYHPILESDLINAINSLTKQ